MPRASPPRRPSPRPSPRSREQQRPQEQQPRQRSRSQPRQRPQVPVVAPSAVATGVPVASVDLQHDVAEAVRRAGDLLLQATRAVQTDAELRDAIVDGVAEQTQLVRRLLLLLEQRARCFVFMLGLLGVLLGYSG